MANRRMYSKTITESDQFLDMSLSTQALYFHLGMQADDEGFVSPNRVLRMIGAQSDELKILCAKQFVIPFENGVVVIRHWKENNYIQSDRKKDTIYLQELAQLTEETSGVYNLDTQCIQNVHVGKDRIGEDRLNTVAKATQEILINNETFSMEELEYIPEHLAGKKPKYGKNTMAVLVRTFAESAGIEIKGTFDASPWSKPLSAIYQYFDKDVDLAIGFIKKASAYFEENNLTYTPHTLHRDLPMIDKWIEAKEDKQFSHINNNPLYE